MRLNQNSDTGFSLIELIVAIGVFLVLVSGVTFLITGSYTTFYGAGNSREMERLSQQALDVLNVIKERSWTVIASNASDSPSAVHIDKDANGNWTLASGATAIGAFTRSILIYNVQRNSSGDIVASGGSNDPSTKKVVILITATGRADYKVEAFLENWESYRMVQTAWSGSSGVNTWTSGSVDYLSQSQMDVPTTSGELMIDFQ